MTTGTENVSALTVLKPMTGQQASNMRQAQNTQIMNADNQYKQLIGLGTKLDIKA